MPVKFAQPYFIAAALGLFAFCGLGADAQANEAVEIGKFGNWAAYTLVEDGKKICYMVGEPDKKEGVYNTRGDVFALITHRPTQSVRDVFSYISGYSYEAGSPASVTIDGKEFSLFTQEETAWTPDGATDSALAKAIQKGSKMVVKGTSKRGNLTTDTFILKGTGEAYKAISKACGM